MKTAKNKLKSNKTLTNTQT